MINYLYIRLYTYKYIKNDFNICRRGRNFDGLLQITSVIGTVLAAVIGWNRTNSVALTALAAFFSWFYILYYVFFIRPSEEAEMEEEELEEEELEEEPSITRPDKGFY